MSQQEIVLACRLVLPESRILPPFESRFQNLMLGLVGIVDDQEQKDVSLRMTPERLEEEKERLRKMARELGYLDNGEINLAALEHDWEKICPRRL